MECQSHNRFYTITTYNHTFTPPYTYTHHKYAGTIIQASHVLAMDHEIDFWSIVDIRSADYGNSIKIILENGSFIVCPRDRKVSGVCIIQVPGVTNPVQIDISHISTLNWKTP